MTRAEQLVLMSIFRSADEIYVETHPLGEDAGFPKVAELAQKIKRLVNDLEKAHNLPLTQAGP